MTPSRPSTSLRSHSNQRPIHLLVSIACLASAAALLLQLAIPGKRVLAEQPTHPAASKPAKLPPTWTRQVAPILYANCTTCHHPGGAGPFSLITYEDARRWAPEIVRVTQTHYMPPWLPEPGYGDFANARRLSDKDLEAIKSWAANGMPRGDSSQAPAPPAYSSGWTLGKPDLVLTVEQPFTLNAGGEDVFRNFILPYPLKDTHYIRAMEIQPGVARIVHHANVLIDRTAEYRRQHPADWQQGVPGMELVVDAGKTFDPDGHFLFWKPDTPALVEPNGMPWRLDPGNDLILNMHLKPSGKTETIRPQIGLYFTDTPPSQLPMLLQLDRDDALDIPAGQADFPVEDEMTLPIAVQLLGIYPHAHYLGKQMECWATLPGKRGGNKLWLIRINDWDIDRQSVYSYKHPISLPRGTVIHMRYVYDNSSGNPHNPHIPPVRVHAGNRSEDEMAHLWLQVLPQKTPSDDAVDPRLLLEEAWMHNRLRRLPNDYVSLYNLGAALAGQGKSEEATAVFHKIVQLNPEDSRSWNALGTAMESAGDWQHAQNSYQHALAIDENNCDARFNLAQSQSSHALYAEAETGFRTMLAKCGDDPETRSGLGSALLAGQHYDQAETEFLQALALKPSSATAAELHEHLAFVYVQTDKSQQAIAELRSAVQSAPDDPAPHALLAQVLSQSGQLQEAIAEQKIALHLRPDDAEQWNNLGVFEARSGDSLAAMHDFKEAQRIDPENAQAKANLARLVAKP
jgi:Flp pilus assembly protein TadD